jgi:hypothetical protein
MTNTTNFILFLAIATILIVSPLASESAFADPKDKEDKLTKLQKECSKEPKKADKIKPHCELLMLLEDVGVIEGPQGETGEAGPQGETGADGAIVQLTSAHFYTNTVAETITPESFGTATATCDGNDEVTGGGYLASHNNINTIVSYPNNEQSWTVQAENTDSTASLDLTAYARCVNLP